MKYLHILLCLMLMAALSNSDQPPAPFYTRIGVTEGNAKVNSEFTLTFSLKALMDLPMSLVIYEIPKGVEWVDGKLVDTIYPYANESLNVSAKLKIIKQGAYRITVHTVIAPAESISFIQHFAKDFYIRSDPISASYSEEPEEGMRYNIFFDSTIGGPLPYPPPGGSYTLSGRIRYYNKLTGTLDPVDSILVTITDTKIKQFTQIIQI